MQFTGYGGRISRKSSPAPIAPSFLSGGAVLPISFCLSFILRCLELTSPPFHFFDLGGPYPSFFLGSREDFSHPRVFTFLAPYFFAVMLRDPEKITPDIFHQDAFPRVRMGPSPPPRSRGSETRKPHIFWKYSCFLLNTSVCFFGLPSFSGPVFVYAGAFAFPLTSEFFPM